MPASSALRRSGRASRTQRYPARPGPAPTLHRLTPASLARPGPVPGWPIPHGSTGQAQPGEGCGIGILLESATGDGP